MICSPKLTAFFIVLVHYAGSSQNQSSYDCYDCEGGPQSDCAKVKAWGVTALCSSNDCYQAYILYQDGALPIVERRCWDRPANTKARDYCDWLKTSASIKNSNAQVVYCKSCSTQLCNTELEFWKKNH